MIEKTYDLKVIINTTIVDIVVPSSKRFGFEREKLPEEIYAIVRQCLKDDADMCQAICGEIRSKPRLRHLP
jgi:hypothetical protein